LRSRRFISSVAAVAVLAGAGAAGAQAHSALILIGSSTLVYEQKPTYPNNVDNNVTISLKEDSLGAYYLVTDPASTGIAFPGVCTPLDDEQQEIRCPAKGIDALYVRLGTGTKVRETTSKITITAPTPATVSGGTVTNAGGPRTSNITVGPVGGNVIYGNPGPGTLGALNGFGDTIHSCPGNNVEADLIDTVIPDCAEPPESPVPLPAEPPPGPEKKPAPTPESGSGPGSTPGGESPGQTTGPTKPSQNTPVVLAYKQPQAVLKQRLVAFGVSVAMPMTVHASGTIRLPGREGTIRLIRARVAIAKVGVSTAVRLRVPGRALAALRRAFGHRHRLSAVIQVEATNPASGIEYVLSRRISLTR
jgi:hypothetical protein